MVKVIISGYNGKMGQELRKLILEDPEIEIIAGVDPVKEAWDPQLVVKSPDELPDNIAENADVVIDFSNPAGTDKLLDFCSFNAIPLVLCTTGLTDLQKEHVKRAAAQTAVLQSANMSLGVNLFLKLLPGVSKTLKPAGFDIEIVESHHRRKLDAPSGTAIALADAMNTDRSDRFNYAYDRSGRHEKRPDGEIGISSVRGGTIPGTHDVIFAGEDEVLTFTHQAYSRAIFAKGAIAAAKFLDGRPAGLYSMQDVIG